LTLDLFEEAQSSMGVCVQVTTAMITFIAISRSQGGSLGSPELEKYVRIFPFKPCKVWHRYLCAAMKGWRIEDILLTPSEDPSIARLSTKAHYLRTESVDKRLSNLLDIKQVLYLHFTYDSSIFLCFDLDEVVSRSSTSVLIACLIFRFAANMVMKVPQNLPLGQILILGMFSSCHQGGGIFVWRLSKYPTALCRFSSALANTGSLPYFPMLLAHIGVPSETIAFWLGFALSMGSVVQFLTAGMWGYISDVVGRKPVILMCQAILMAGALMFGFSTSLAMVLVSRAVVGFSSGDVGILRTSLAEKVKDKA
jgi:hypothetical protein